MNVFTLGLWEIFWWGLNYFDQFILRPHKVILWFSKRGKKIEHIYLHWVYHSFFVCLDLNIRSQELLLCLDINIRSQELLLCLDINIRSQELLLCLDLNIRSQELLLCLDLNIRSQRTVIMLRS